jgi:Na+/H+ antiporter NhaC
MGILVPMVVPLAHTLLVGRDGSVTPNDPIFLSSIAGVLAGSVFGDHCSPISDTTVLSSMASACDHLDHVRTQLPYAVVVALVAMFFGSLATSYGFPPLAAYALGGGVLFAILRFVGKPVPTGLDG